MKQVRVYCVVTLALALLASDLARAGEVENQVAMSKNQLGAKVKEVEATVKDVLGIPFEDQVKKAMDELRKDPRSFKLQVQVANVLIAQTDRLLASLGKTKDADIVSIRDRLVKGLEALAAEQTAERDRYLTRAKETNLPEYKQRYEELAQVCSRFAQAYAAQAEQYKAVPISAQLQQVQAALEYLASAKQVLTSLRDGLIPIVSDNEVLHQLERLTVTVGGVQQSL
jgi:hypothetical protein